MSHARVGSIACFVLTVQFVLTILWIIVAWPENGFSGLADSMAAYFQSSANQPVLFGVMNFYNISFALSAMVLALIMYEHFPEFRLATAMAVSLIVIAASLFFASGVVPLVAARPVIATGDASAVRTLVEIATGLLLGATMACGFALVLFAILGLRSGRLPQLLSVMLLVVGVIEIFEFAVPIFLLLDPLIGTFWSLWLGILLWNDRLKLSLHPESSPQRAELV